MEDLMSHVTLADGRRIVLHDEDDISLSLVSNNGVEETLPFSHLPGNYGGGTLLLSPSQRYVIFSYFSGESEEGFALLEIANNRLKLLYDSDYLYGEDANYSFANDERTIIQTFRTGAWYQNEAEIDENGDMYYEFGELNLFSLETNNLNRHTILVYPSDDWKEEETDIGTFSFSGIADGMLKVKMPWGIEAFEYPLQETLVVKFNK